jgi:four helix bundle protein
MNKAELERRTKEFSLNLIRFLQSLPKNYLGEALGRQLLKSGTSIGANYRKLTGQSPRRILSIS